MITALILGIFLNIVLYTSAEKREMTDLGKYDLSFNISDDSSEIHYFNAHNNTNNSFQKNIIIKDRDGVWSLYFNTTELTPRKEISSYEMAKVLKHFLEEKFSLNPFENNIKGTSCIWENYKNIPYMENNKNAYKAWFYDPTLKKNIVGFHYYFNKYNSSYVIIWTDSNEEKVNLIFNTSYIVLNESRYQ